jgi:uncharacterized membrane protein YgcG
LEGLFAKRDDNATVTMRVILLGLAQDKRFAKSFAMICRDVTDELKDQEAVEAAKRESQRLLRQMIPKEMLVRMERDELFFSAPIVTAIYVNIYDLPSYATMSNTGELFGHIEKVFGAFESLIDVFPSVHRVSVMSDLYIAAAGLFGEACEASLAAKEAVSFGLKCLDAIEELNIQLSTLLQLRIGIHTGGPVFVGVFGEKQIFKVFGETLNCAEQLQCEAPSGMVVISEMTYEMVADAPLNIEPRGETSFSGVGSVKTYSVQPGKRLGLEGMKRPSGSGSGGSGSGSGGGSSGNVYQPSLQQLLSNAAGFSHDL